MYIHMYVYYPFRPGLSWPRASARLRVCKAPAATCLYIYRRIYMYTCIYIYSIRFDTATTFPELARVRTLAQRQQLPA